MNCHPIAQASGRPISIMTLASPEWIPSFKVSCHRMSGNERGCYYQPSRARFATPPFEQPLLKELAGVRRNFVATMPTLDCVRQSSNHRRTISLGVFTLEMKDQSPLGLLKPFRGR